MNPTRVLLTGATGYIGGRLLPVLESLDIDLRCLTRRPGNLKPRVAPTTEVVEGDVFDFESLLRALEGVDVAYYMVHSLAGVGDFEQNDRTAAEQFARAASECSVGKIIYLGGLGSGEGLSKHLASRQEVGEVLRSGTVPVIELRASIVIGSGSLSFEMVRSLVEKLPVMTTPRWVRTPAQPIAIEDVLTFLTRALARHAEVSEMFEIGGADVVSYQGIMDAYARARGLRRYIVPVPVLTPRLSGLWLALVTPLYYRIGRWLMDGVKNPTVVADDRANREFGVEPKGIDEAIRRALVNEDAEFARTRWSDSDVPQPEEIAWGGERIGSRLVYSRSIEVPVSRQEAFLPIQYIGGENGWYSYPWLWTLRSTLDKVFGGVGGSRGRRDPQILLPGDVVDFWRVEALEQYRMLRLKAEMKLPGRGWLQFDVADAREGSWIRVTAMFEPRGLRGLAYWYALYPAHLIVFRRMLHEIRRYVVH